MRRQVEADRLFRQAMNYASQCGVDIGQFTDRRRFRHHDVGHFYRAALLAGHIADATPGADFTGAVLGAALHDIGRVRDDHDPEHGERGAEIVARHALLDPWLDPQASLPSSLLAEHLSRFKLDDFTGLEGPFVIVLVDLDDTDRRVPATNKRDLLGCDRIGEPRVTLALDVQTILALRTHLFL